MKKIRVGLNGFGRIGRAFTRMSFGSENSYEIVAINTAKSKPEIMSHLLKYDSIYHKSALDISFSEKQMVINGQNIVCSNEKDPKLISWGNSDVDLVLDCSGAFKTEEELSCHLHGAVKRVLISAPTNDPKVPHIVLGVNSQDFDFSQKIISNASCTTNCIAPMLWVLERELGIENCFFVTNHAYTSSQALLDEASKTPQRSRAAALNIIPTTTGAASAVSKVIPSLASKIAGDALRVPVPVGSITQIYANLKNSVSNEELNSLYKKYSRGLLLDILAYEEVPLVSSDYIGSTFSVVIDGNYTKVINGRFVSVTGWYDNEWGYSSRLVDLVNILAQKI